MDQLEEDYNELSMWALGVINSHQLTTSMMIGMTIGLADAIIDKRDKTGKDIDMLEVTQYGVMRACIEKRREEIQLYLKELNELRLPLPVIDDELIGEALEKQYDKGYELGRLGRWKCNGNEVRETMNKLMESIGKLPELDDDESS